MLEGLSGGCRAGLALTRCSQLAIFAIQQIGSDVAAVWLVEEDVYQVLLFRNPFGRPSEGDGTRDATSAFEEPGRE